jgi:hypothetical protein
MHLWPDSVSGKRARVRTSFCAALILFCTACSTAMPPPTAALNSARDAIVRAEESGARQHADAELNEAQQKLVQAERSVRGEQMVEAERLAQESMITAQLASARSEAAKALEITREMRRSVDALAEELRRQEIQK